jgi:hypothetical protein
MPIYARKTALLAKLETTYGVDATPTTDDVVEIFDFSITPNIDKVERNPYRPTLSPVAAIPGKRYTELSFYVELKGAGIDSTTGLAKQPKVVDLLQGCGFELTINNIDSNNDGTTDAVEYILKPTSTDFKSLTFYAYLDGVLYKVTGARGNAQIQMEANNIGKIQFTFTGLFETPVDAAFPTVTIEEVIPPLIKNVNLTMGGYAPILSSFEVNMNNDIVQRDDMNAAEGVGGIDIIGRNPSGSLNPDMMLAAEYDIWTQFESGTPQSIEATVGSEVGNKVSINIPQAVYNSIKIDERDSIRVYTTDFTCIGNDDEVQITFA